MAFNVTIDGYIDVIETSKSIEATQALLQSFFTCHNTKYETNGKKMFTFMVVGSMMTNEKYLSK